MLLDKNHEDISNFFKKQSSMVIHEKNLQNTRKCKECKSFKKGMINASTEKRLLKNTIKSLIEEREEVKRTFHSIFQKLLNDIENEEQEGPQTLTQSLISELIKNSKIVPQGRRYTKTIQSVCFLIFSYSPIDYSTLCQFFPLPSQKTITNETSKK